MWHIYQENNQIPFDPKQSCHITLFKPNPKHSNYYNIYTTEKANKYWREYTFNLNNMSITDIVACQMARGMPELMKYNVKDHKTTTKPVLTKLQKLENIKLKLRELRKEDAKCNSQIEELNNHIEHLNISKSTIDRQTLFTHYLQTQRINTQKITQG